jgi:hypothetical protein
LLDNVFTWGLLQKVKFWSKSMQKPLTSDGEGFAKNQFNRIVPQAQTSNQVFQHLSSYVQQRELTNALELLEKRGHYGEIAIFIIASIQDMGGGR